MMKKLIGLIGTVTVVAGLQAATLNEWNFYHDPAGIRLSNAYNSAGGASFALNPGYTDSALLTDGIGNLICTQNDPQISGMWTNGAMLSADLGTSTTTGIQYLRYDFSYNLSSSNNDSGCVVGFAFYDGVSNKLVGVALQYDVGATTNASYQVTELTNMTDTVGTVAVVAKLDLNLETLDVWYDLTGNVGGFSSTSPMATVSNLTLTSFDSLRFQATGDIQPSNSTDQVEVSLLRTADSWADAVASAPVAPAAKYANEWTFERDVDGRSLSETINSGTNSPLAQFSAGGNDVYTTNRIATTPHRVLLCTGNDTTTNGVWTNGVLLNAALTSSTSGVHYLRYDVEYSLTNSLNDSGTVLGAYFTGESGDKAAGLVLGYDTGNLTNTVPAGRTLTPVTNGLALSGTLIAIAEADLDHNTLKVWYSLNGSNPTNYAAPAFTNTLGLTSITNLRFHATGDFRPVGSSDYAAVDNIRHTIGTTAGAAAWTDIIESAADLSAPPELTAVLSDSLNGGMELGETNLLTVVISNTGSGIASAATSTLTDSGAPGDFTITSNNTANTPVILNPGDSTTNTYTVVANTKGPFVFTAQAICNETNSVPVTLNIVVGAQIDYLTNSISEPGGAYPGLYEPGETLNIAVFSTNNGAKAVSNIVNLLTAASSGFSISPLSATGYPVLNVGESTSTVYQVVIGGGVSNGTYTFNVTNRAGTSTWNGSFTLDVFARQPNSDWVKANNTNDLNQTTSWSNLVVPNSTDRAVFTTNITAALTNNLGSDLSWGGIVLISNTASWTVSGTNTLTTGTAGINMSQAQADLTIISKLALVATQTWNVATSRTLTVSGSISGTNTAPLIKSGLGTLVITNTANSYSGNTIVSNGILAVANDNALGKGTLTINGSTLATAGTALLTNNTVLNNAALFNNANDLTIDGSISGSGSLTKTGAGTLFLSSDNSYTGGTTNNGTIRLGTPGSLGSGSVVMNNGSVLYVYPAFPANSSMHNNIQLNGSVTFTNYTSSPGYMSFDGDITGTGSLTISGYQFYLLGNNTFSGGLNLNQSSWLRFNGEKSLGSGQIKTLRAANLLALNNAFITNSIGMTNNTFRMHANGMSVVLSGPMSGTGQFQVIDSNTGNISIPNANSGRTGTTLIRAGRLTLGNGKSLGSGQIQLQPQYVNQSFEVSADLTGTNSVANDIYVNAFYYIDSTSLAVVPIVFNLDHDLELSGPFHSSTDEASIEKNGVGALILSGVNTYLLPINIHAGSLVINNSVSSDTITMDSGTTLGGTGSVQTVSMAANSFLDLSGGGMTFRGNLTMGENVFTKLAVKNSSSALHGNGSNSLVVDGTLRFNFTGNAAATNGAVFTVFENWGTLTDNGVQIFSFGLSPFLKLDTSNLFVDGTVKVVSSGRLSAQAIEIIVPQGSTASASTIISNPTGSSLSFAISPDASWPMDSYAVTTQGTTRVGFTALTDTPNPATSFTNWTGAGNGASDFINIGFDFPFFGSSYTEFSVNRYGYITLKSSFSSAVISPFQSATPVDQSTVRYKKETDRLVVSWGNRTGHEFQAWLYASGKIVYLYERGIWTGGTISATDATHNQIISHIPGSTSDDSLILEASSWVSNSPQSGFLPGGSSQTLTFTADAAHQPLGDTVFTAVVHWGDGQTSEIGVFISVIAEAPQLELPSTITFSGLAGLITSTNVTVTNSGTSVLNYTITDSGLQGSGYTVTNTDYSWVNVADVDANQLIFNGNVSQKVSIGFPFVFYGDVFTNLAVNINGTLTLGDEQIISPFSGALSTNSNTNIRYACDNNKFAVTWENIALTGNGSNQTFQAVLYRDGKIRFQYKGLNGEWPYQTIQIESSGNYKQGTLLNSETTFIATNYTTTSYTTNKPGTEYTWTVTVTNGTNLVLWYYTTIGNKALEFTPGSSRIISATPVSGSIAANGGTANITIYGDARSLTSGGANNVTNSTTLVFNYSGFTANTLVTFIATNSVESAYPLAAASLAVQEDMWGGDSVFTSQQNPAGYPTGSYLISWPVPDDSLTRIYAVWFSTNLVTGWDPTPLTVLTNTYSYVDIVHTNEPVIYYKVTVQ